MTRIIIAFFIFSSFCLKSSGQNKVKNLVKQITKKCSQVFYSLDGKVDFTLPDGTQGIRHPDGSKGVYYPSGQQIITYPTGLMVKTFPNRDKLIQSPHDITFYQLSDGNKLLIDQPDTKDGRTVKTHSDGSQEIEYPDGRSGVKFPGGGMGIRYPDDGRIVIKYPDGGYKLILPNGDKIFLHPSGQRVIKRSNGLTVKTFSDGSSELIKPPNLDSLMAARGWGTIL